MQEANGLRKRHITQWGLAPVVIITIAFGWKYPLLGFTVPAIMLVGMIGGTMKGRYVCGSLCPRGGLFDRILSRISFDRPIPQFFRTMKFRWPIFALLMGFILYRISLNPTDINHLGRTFWMMCVITTGVGVVFGIFMHHRFWCSFCPMGTMQNALGGWKHPLHIDSVACRECRECEAACPLGLSIVKHKSSGWMLDRDCMKCPECVSVCKQSALGLT